MPTPYQLLKAEAKRLGITVYPGMSAADLTAKINNKRRYLKQQYRRPPPQQYRRPPQLPPRYSPRPKYLDRRPKYPDYHRTKTSDRDNAIRYIKTIATKRPDWDNSQIAAYIDHKYAKYMGVHSRLDAVNAVLGRRRVKSYEKDDYNVKHKELEKKKMLDELLKNCGTKCFADRYNRVPICPLCDKRKCYCYPECVALKKAYSAGHDPNRLEDLAKRLDCEWVQTKRHSSSRRKSSSPPPRKRSLSRRKSSSPSSARLIGKTFIAPDGIKHRVIKVGYDKVETVTEKGQNYRVPINVVMKFI